MLGPLREWKTNSPLKWGRTGQNSAEVSYQNSTQVTKNHMKHVISHGEGANLNRHQIDACPHLLEWLHLKKDGYQEYGVVRA